MLEKLRAHHLLCIPLYQGEGYGDVFCENMSSTIKVLNSEKVWIKIIDTSDRVCSACPNLTNQNTCSGDENRVVQKDSYLIKALDIDVEKEYRYHELQKWVIKHITEDIFEESCRTCSWKRAGLCTYEKLKSMGSGK